MKSFLQSFNSLLTDCGPTEWSETFEFKPDTLHEILLETGGVYGRPVSKTTLLKGLRADLTLSWYNLFCKIFFHEVFEILDCEDKTLYKTVFSIKPMESACPGTGELHIVNFLTFYQYFTSNARRPAPVEEGPILLDQPGTCQDLQGIAIATRNLPD